MALLNKLSIFLGFEREAYIEPEHIFQKADTSTKPREWDNKELDPNRQKKPAKKTFTDKLQSIGQIVRNTQKNAEMIWRRAVMASSQYCDFMDLSGIDIENLENMGNYISVKLSERITINLIPKNTCGIPYGGSWQHLLQPRYEHSNIKGFGGGTTFIATLSDFEHLQVLEAIEEGKAKIKQGRIWP